MKALNLVEFKNALEAHRVGRGMSMDDMAKRFGMSRAQYWRVVSDKSPVDMEFVVKGLREMGYRLFVVKDIMDITEIKDK